jgi:WD40 repeat protein/serine/threonine protein kinase
MSPCPSLDQLEGFLDECASDSQRISLSEHIDGCAVCQARLDELTGEDSLASSASVVLRQSTVPAPTFLSSSSHTDFLARLKENPPSSSGRLQTKRAAKNAETVAFSAVAGYEIMSEVGRGGMGVVYKARHVGLDRLVALKMILAGPHAGPKELARFRQEAEAVARLHHPNIIQIYDIGESDGRPYLALEFVEGDSLAHLLQGTPQPHLPAARLLETLAGAIHYAHQQGIIHRDLKPANVLLEAGSRQQAAGSNASSLSAVGCLLPAVPKITDFGLAKRLDSRSTGTHSGDVVGTPSYMAPEQAASKGKAVGPATDVYALGAILYELLTGRPPFRGPSALDTVLQVLHDDPVRPSYLRQDLPRDLETICLKCLAKDPAKRYASAQGLADDLVRFRKGQPIKARPVGLHERAWKWARHRPASASLVVGMMLVVVLSYTIITWLWQDARLARNDMEFQREQAEIARDDMKLEREKAEEARRNEAEQRKQARTSLYFSRIAQSQLQWRVNDFPSAEQGLAKCLPAEGQEDDRGWEWHYLQGLFRNDLFTLPHGHSGLGGSLAYDRQGNRIATVVSGPTVGETPQPSEVRIWDARTGGLMHTWASPSTLHRLAFHPDGSRLALATTDGAILIWDSATGKELLRRDLHQQTVWALAFSPDGKTIASAGSDGTVKLWDSTSGKVHHDIRAHKDEIQSVAFHPHKAIVASGGQDTTVKLWDTTTGKEIQTLRGHKTALSCVAFSPDGHSLVSASGNGNLKIWDLETGRIVQSLTGDTGGVLNVVFSPDGRYLAKAGKDGSVRIWHITTGVERMAFRGHTTPVESLHFSPDCQRVASISPGDGVAKVWDLTRHPEYATFARTDADVEAIMFADDGRRLTSITVGGRLQAWDASTGMLLEERMFPIHKEIVSPAVPLSFAKNAKYLAARSEQDARVVKRWDIANGTELTAYRGHALPVVCVRFSGDARYLATCACAAPFPLASPAPGGDTGVSHEIKIWDAASGNSLATMTGKGCIFNVAFSPDNRLVAVGGQEGTVTLLDWQSSQKHVKIAGHQGDVTGLAFSLDGKLLASAGMEDRRVKIWQVSALFAGDPKAWHTLAAPSLICDLTFSPDSRRLAAISRDMVKMWDVETGHEALTLRGAAQRHRDPSFNPRLAFSPDGTSLAGTNWDESISTWEAPPLDSEEQFAKLQEKRRRFADERTSFWHLQEAELCMVYRNLNAARFHLSYLKDDLRSVPLQARKDRLEATVREISKESK